jgi:putative MATE family efflux protein
MTTEKKAQLTEGPITRTLINLTGPMVIGMLGMVAFNLMDTYFIGQLGIRQLAAMSFTFPVVMTIGSMAQGLGVGASAVISRAIGSGHQEDVRRLTTHALLLSILLVVIFAIIGLLSINPIFEFLGASPDVLPLIKQYMTIWFLGVTVVVVPMVGNNAIRATGDTKTPSMVMLVAVILNIILDPLLIFGLGPFPRLELAGAALASVLARTITLFVSLWVLYAREKMITFAVPKSKELLNSWKQILYIGLPTAATNMIVPLSAGLITRLVAGFGAAAVAAFGVATRIESFGLLVVMALTGVLSPFVGQNWGAKKYERANTGIRTSQRFAIGWGLLMVVFLGMTSGPLATIFNADPAVISTVRLYFWILPISYGLYGILKEATVVLSVLEKPLRSSVLTLAQTFAIYIPLAYLGSEILGLPGIFGALALSYIVTGIAAYLWLKRTLTESMEYDFLHRIVTVQDIADQPVSLGYWVARLYRFGRTYYDLALSPYHLDTRTLSFLTTALRNEGLTRSELSDMLAVNELVTDRALSSLVDLGYIQPNNLEEGIFVTEKAREIAPNVKGILQAWSEQLAEGFTAEEKELALSLLRRMNTRAMESLQQTDMSSVVG